MWGDDKQEGDEKAHVHTAVLWNYDESINHQLIDKELFFFFLNIWIVHFSYLKLFSQLIML